MEDMFYHFLEGEELGERERCEREASATSHVHQDSTGTHNSGVCPDQEWNVQLFGPWDDPPN